MLICAFTLDAVNRDEQDPPSADPSLRHCSSFFKHMSEPLCATQLKRRTAMLVEKSATSFPTYYSSGQCCHTMPWNDSWAFGVAPVRHFCSLKVIFWLLSRTKIGLISSNMPSGMMSWCIYWYIRLSTSLFLLPPTPAA